MPRPSLKVVFAVLLLPLAGCAQMDANAQSHAANDFQCNRSDVVVVHTGTDTGLPVKSSYHATGCGHQADYTCTAHQGVVACVVSGSIQ